MVSCENVTKKYKNHKALDSLSIKLEENRIIGLIGRNGAGKTTLLKSLAGEIVPTSGDIKVFGEKPFNNLIVSANSIYVDDQMNFSLEMRLSEILEAAKMFYPNWDQRFADKLLDYFGISLHIFHDQLSKGKASTFNAILGLASRCPLTLFDEPTTGMDYSVRQDFYRALLKDYMAYPRTMIVSSHLLNELETILEEVVLIKNGSCVLHAPMEDFKEHAVGLTGNQDVIQSIVDQKDIIFKKELSQKQVYMVINNAVTDSQKLRLGEAGVRLSKVDAADLSMHLTSDTKGGIDDVFKSS
ncbi:ATP-binding cassette domain-containing protein [Piscibacillus sp. B03]|uniref:ATP-binding cassette domain-containing protein n=1 Tax=Piscibacillus sp. B03 TaxID=3457430 RepID=UPI003FCD2EAB